MAERIPAAERRKRLISAGLRVIAREGIHGATVRAIVAEAQMPLASFHYVFNSRDEMIGEAYRYATTNAVQDALEQLPEEIPLQDMVRIMLTAWIEEVIADDGPELGVMEIMAYCLRTEHLRGLPGEVQAHYIETARPLVAFLEARSNTKLIGSEEDFIKILITMTDGLTYAWLRTRDREAAHAAAAAFAIAAAAQFASVDQAADPQ